MKTTIAIVDDHTLIAQALSNILSSMEEFEVLYDCENGSKLIEKFKNPVNIPRIVLLDISMPIMNGFETAQWLKENHPNVLIMVLSMQDDERSVIKMIRNGAHGYLLKNIHPLELKNALNTLLNQNYFYPDWASRIIISSFKDNNIQITFSDREKEFLSYVATELTYKEIADKMFCSPRTVDGYRDSLFEKLNVKTRVGLAVYFLKNNEN